DSLLFQEFKTFFVWLAPSIQAGREHLKSGNIVRGREIRPCQRSCSGKKKRENHNAFEHVEFRIHETKILWKWLWARFSARSVPFRTFGMARGLQLAKPEGASRAFAKCENQKRVRTFSLYFCACPQGRRIHIRPVDDECLPPVDRVLHHQTGPRSVDPG